MEKPSLSEVKEYFKNAKTIECLADKSVNDIDSFPYLIKGEGVFEDGRWFYSKNSNNDNTNDRYAYFIVWSPEQGYAKILTYKNTEPKFEITKEQIITIEADGINYIKEWFPEAFETVSKAGKWYKCNHIHSLIRENKSLIFISDVSGKNIDGFGFDFNGQWFDKKRDCGTVSKNWEEATTEEVTEALKKEAVKRGFKNSTYFLDTNNETYFIDGDKFSFDLKKNKLYINGWEIFCDGKWAEVLETKTIQEAEELLKELGHNFKIV